MPPSFKELTTAAEKLKDLLIDRAQGGSPDDGEYRRIRKAFLDDVRTTERTPSFVRDCRSIPEFWNFIQPKFPTYRERGTYLAAEFNPLIEHLEKQSRSPMSEVAPEVITRLDWDGVQLAWRKARERQATDPEGAITAARTLLEATCKHILDEATVSYDPKADLPKLYGLVSARLNLAPGQHVEKVFKQVLGGCTAVVEGLGAIRSKIGDAHGQGKKPVRPAPRHAELVVNLAGSMATFLAASWEQSKGSPGS